MLLDEDPAVRFGESAGLYRSDDGGDNWQQLTAGLPSCRWGRSGIDVAPLLDRLTEQGQLVDMRCTPRRVFEAPSMKQMTSFFEL